MSTPISPATPMKTKGFVDENGNHIFAKLGSRERLATTDRFEAEAAKHARIANQIVQEQYFGTADPDKPFIGAQPRLLKKPDIASEDQSRRATYVAIKAIQQATVTAKGVLLFLGQDTRESKVARGIIESSIDDHAEEQPVTVGLASDWQNTLPFVEGGCKIPAAGERLLIYIGTPGKYCAMCIRSDKGQFNSAYDTNRLVVLCKGVCMLPIGTQMENIFGVNEAEILQSIAVALRKKGVLGWAHGAGTKASFMQRAYGYPSPLPMPEPMKLVEDGSLAGFDYFAEYLTYINRLKLAKPELTVKNYYDTGLTVSVLMNCVVEHGVSLLTDGDGMAMLRDASIGHIVSKLNQVVAVESLAHSKGVYNFFIGDGACRLNGGVELALHLCEGHRMDSFITMFLFNNYKWAIEDNLVAATAREHALYNHDFYDLLGAHERVCVCENEIELRAALTFLSLQTSRYLKGEVAPGLSLVIVRGLMADLPPVIGDIEPIRKSKEMAFLRGVLGKFCKGCEQKVPLYGCSAFEYIQYLHIFLEEMPEGKKYQYVCGRTDIQAAHMAGYHQPEGKCVLFINDVYGINSLGESMRFILSGFGGRQVLVVVWHPSLLKVIDHFHLHRPPMVWPSLGPTLMKYYVRKESDALFVDFEGHGPAQEQVEKAMEVGTPLIVVNMMPDQECNYISMDVRIKAVPPES